LDDPGFLGLPGAEPFEVVVGRGDANVVFLPAAANESLDSWESAFGRTPEQEVTVVVVSEIADEIETRVSAVK
jgi:hypothetical protein